LENCGVAVTIVTEADKEAMKDLLRKLHAEGFVHGDAALRNFVKVSSGKWRLIDLGRAKRTSGKQARRKDFHNLEKSLCSKGY
jgi:tRNA A-37 threonylcarbamoyl transferase component Bud32